MSRILSIIEPGAIQQAVDRLNAGEVIAFPTDTVYALAGSLDSPVAARRIYAIKGRRFDKPLPVLLSNADRISRVANTPDRRTLALADRFWPGPLTLIMPARADAIAETVGEDKTVALRVPDHRQVRALIEAAGGALATTSANLSGAEPSKSAVEVERQLGSAVDLILDDGQIRCGVASTIVRVIGDRFDIVRLGAIPANQIETAWRELRPR
ncbi:MAG: threonylcarbamoyl-AMP synthase [Chloroflexia bacterium]|nr:threonylcarbamoyl-AMP synthase [Chloroflexia bacterium]